jgi:hypothetical protein
VNTILLKAYLHKEKRTRFESDKFNFCNGFTAWNNAIYFIGNETVTSIHNKQVHVHFINNAKTRECLPSCGIQ